jgi:hypothetical protein
MGDCTRFQSFKYVAKGGVGPGLYLRAQQLHGSGVAKCAQFALECDGLALGGPPLIRRCLSHLYPLSAKVYP